MIPTSPAVECKALWKIFKTGRRVVKALCDVTFTVAEGEFVSLRGSSGSGKSTLLNIIGALDHPTDGEVHTLSRSVNMLSRNERGAFRRDNIGFVFQDLTLVPHLTAMENVALPLIFGWRGHERGKRQAAQDVATDLLLKFSLGDRLDHLPHELSYGERQRVAMARAVARTPRLLLADEPTANLDNANVERLHRILVELRKSGTTILAATHDPRLEAYADRLIQLEQGQLVSEAHRGD